MRDNSGIIIAILLLLVVVLSGVVAYTFFVKPAVSGYIVNAQNQGIQFTLSSILLQIQQRGYVEIPVSENQTLILVPYNPNQQSQPQEINNSS
ncbi:hypothetical protein HY448_00655 [Candidatus Pacearchaeota archaeon]|nr:hypothetical protein [Candidatus Pacearchaeota archaeon]